MRGIVCGIGINDADYVVVKKVEYIDSDGNIKIKKVTCPFYRAWTDMLSRCYREKYHKIFPSYKNCSVCDDWLRFTNFKRWMEQQDYIDNVLDKDLIRGQTQSAVIQAIQRFINNLELCVITKTPFKP